MNVVVHTQSIHDAAVECRIIFIQKDHSLTKQLKHLMGDGLYPNLEKLAAARNFVGGAHDSMLLPVPGDSVQYYLLIGIGAVTKKSKIPVELYRRALAKGIRTAIATRCSSVAVELPDADLFNVSAEYLAQQTVIIANMTAYHFDEYITSEDRKEHNVQELVVCVDGKERKKIEQEVANGTILANAINMARHWIDSPPLHLTPVYLADKARSIAQDYGLKVTVFDEKQIIEMGMGGLASVSRGSDIDCQLAILEYKTEKKDAPTVVLVGKGITFDSGGLSLKPAQSMETMKEDMSGAAAVIATMQVLAQFKPNVNVIGMTPLSENLPSGKASKPGDIIKFYNGKTAEIKNTDAEGRLILADALSYAVKHYAPDAMVDIATLTGACAYALGPFYTGMMTLHDDMADRLHKASLHSGDLVWRLPMGDDYNQAIRSDVADICNIGDNRIKAGAVTAAHFLQHFVGNVPWAHLDIAGTAFDVPNIPYYRRGATGAGIRLMVDLVMNWE